MQEAVAHLVVALHLRDKIYRERYACGNNKPSTSTSAETMLHGSVSSQDAADYISKNTLPLP